MTEDLEEMFGLAGLELMWSYFGDTQNKMKVKIFVEMNGQRGLDF